MNSIIYIHICPVLDSMNVISHQISQRHKQDLLLLALAYAGGLLHSLILYSQGVLDVGDVVAYFGLLQLLGFPTFVSLFAYSQVSLGVAGAKRILELINKENDLDQNVAGYTEEMVGEIEFKDVTYIYEKGEPVYCIYVAIGQKNSTVACLRKRNGSKS